MFPLRRRNPSPHTHKLFHWFCLRAIEPTYRILSWRKKILCHFQNSADSAESPFTFGSSGSPYSLFGHRISRFGQVWPPICNPLALASQVMDSTAVSNTRLSSLLCRHLSLMMDNYSSHDFASVSFGLSCPH